MRCELQTEIKQRISSSLLIFKHFRQKLVVYRRQVAAYTLELVEFSHRVN